MYTPRYTYRGTYTGVRTYTPAGTPPITCIPGRTYTPVPTRMYVKNSKDSRELKSNKKLIYKVKFRLTARTRELLRREAV